MGTADSSEGGTGSGGSHSQASREVSYPFVQTGKGALTYSSLGGKYPHQNKKRNNAQMVRDCGPESDYANVRERGRHAAS
ncbi:hypothetical protein ES703_78431 [subsurface metagenome]